MKRLINEAYIRKASQNHERVVIGTDTLITPSARDLAEELGVHLCTCAGGGKSEGCCCSHGKHEHVDVKEHDEDGISEHQIYEVLKMALDAGLWTEAEMREALENLV